MTYFNDGSIYHLGSVVTDLNKLETIDGWVTVRPVLIGKGGVIEGGLGGKFNGMKISELSKNNQSVDRKLLKGGGKLWEKGIHKRVYIENDDLLHSVFGLKVERYKNGGIKSAELHGEKLSNNKAHKALLDTPYYDVNNKKWVSNLTPNDDYK